MRNPRKVVRTTGLKGKIKRMRFLLNEIYKFTPNALVKLGLTGMFVTAVAPKVAYAETIETPDSAPIVQEQVISDEMEAALNAVTDSNAMEPVSQETISVETTESTIEEAPIMVTEEVNKKQAAESIEEVTKEDTTETVLVENAKETSTEESVENDSEVVLVEQEVTETKEAEETKAEVVATEATQAKKEKALDITSWVPGHADENGNINVNKDTNYVVITLADGSTVIWTATGPNGDTLGNPSQEELLNNLQNSGVVDPNFKFDKDTTYFVDGTGNIVIKTPSLDNEGNQIMMYPQVDENGIPIFDENGNLIYNNPNPVDGFEPIASFNENAIGTLVQNENGEYVFNLDGSKVSSVASGQYTQKEYLDPDKQEPIKPITPNPEVPVDPEVPEEPKTPETPETPSVPSAPESSGKLAKTGDGINITALITSAALASGLMTGAYMVSQGLSKRLNRKLR